MAELKDVAPSEPYHSFAGRKEKRPVLSEGPFLSRFRYLSGFALCAVVDEASVGRVGLALQAVGNFLASLPDNRSAVVGDNERESERYALYEEGLARANRNVEMPRSDFRREISGNFHPRSLQFERKIRH